MAAGRSAVWIVAAAVLLCAAAPSTAPTLSPAASPTTAPATAPASPAMPSQVEVRVNVIRFLEERIRRDPQDVLALNRLSGEYLRRFRQSGDDADLMGALQMAEDSLKVLPSHVNKGALAARAKAAFSLHRFDQTVKDARQLAELDPGKLPPLETLGDALLERGDYDEAGKVYQKLASAEDPHFGTEARLARQAWLKGDIAEARRRSELAVKLASRLAPPDPEAAAWAHVRAGELNFMTGDWAAAERHYAAALASHPGDWAALDHQAELLAARKRYDEAVDIYRGLVARVARPELFQALGDVYRDMGNPDEARAWHSRALKGYLQSAEQSPHYYHHLSGFYSDTEPNPAEAVKWARKDLEVRRSVYAYDSLAWAIYQAGDYPAAAEAMDKALALGTSDSHLLYHASLIYFRAGNPAKARDPLRRAGEANPKFMEFHVHR